MFLISYIPKDIALSSLTNVTVTFRRDVEECETYSLRNIRFVLQANTSSTNVWLISLIQINFIFMLKFSMFFFLGFFCRILQRKRRIHYWWNYKRYSRWGLPHHSKVCFVFSYLFSFDINFFVIIVFLGQCITLFEFRIVIFDFECRWLDHISHCILVFIAWHMAFVNNLFLTGRI